MAIDPPRRGDVWSIDLGTPVGQESGSRRYGLVMSADEQNRYGLATVLPITQTRTGYPSNVEVKQGAGGPTATSYVQVEQVRTVSTRRFDRQMGTLGVVDLIRVERVLRLILTLP